MEESTANGGRLPRASRWEILGAWLHLWTPPRGVYVPPPPRGRRLVLFSAAIGIPLVAVITVLAVVFANSRHAAATRERRETARSVAQERARLRVEQTLHRGRATAVPHAGSPAAIRAARGTLIGALQTAITRDALARYRRGQLDNRVQGTICQPYAPGATGTPPRPPLHAHVGKYQCIASTGALQLGRQTRVTSGFPFWARVFFTRGTFVWCKVNPLAGEGVAGTGAQVTVPLPRACDLSR